MAYKKIVKKDWDRVRDLATAIANQSEPSAKQSRKLLVNMNEYLDSLEEKYGKHPSIMATRADYTQDGEESVRLLEDAYDLAAESDDELNIVLISVSLAQLFLESQDTCDVKRGRRWFRIAKSIVDKNSHKYNYELHELNNLRPLIRKMEREGVKR